MIWLKFLNSIVLSGIYRIKHNINNFYWCIKYRECQKNYLEIFQEYVEIEILKGVHKITTLIKHWECKKNSLEMIQEHVEIEIFKVAHKIIVLINDQISYIWIWGFTLL